MGNAKELNKKAKPSTHRHSKPQARLRSKEEQRRYNMSRIKSSNTSIEIKLRKTLWRAGIRYRKNYKLLPGRPDIALTKHKIAIFCDGDFWHGRDWSAKKLKLQSNKEYWIAKIERNIARDNDIDKRLRNLGWTVLRFWGKDIEKNAAACVEDIKNVIFETILDSCTTTIS